MRQAAFAPGFRFSALDGLVLVGGTAAAIVLATYVWWWSFVVAFVLAHFFLFCNVVRMARPLELAWAGVFVVLASGTVALETPGWLITTLVSLVVTVVVVEMRKPSIPRRGLATDQSRLADVVGIACCRGAGKEGQGC